MSKRENLTLKESKVREEFRRYFVKIKKKLKLEPEMENVLWLHLKASGNAEAAKFDDGIKHFGYRL